MSQRLRTFTTMMIILFLLGMIFASAFNSSRNFRITSKDGVPHQDDVLTQPEDALDVPTNSNGGGKNNAGLYSGYFVENAGQMANGDVYFYGTINGIKIGFMESAVALMLIEHPDRSGFERYSAEDPWQLYIESLKPMSIRGVLVRISFEDSNPVTPQGRMEIPHKINYFLGNESSKWRTNLRSYREIVYPDLYDGIDLLYRVIGSGNGKQQEVMKYEFVVHPGADPNRIALLYEGIDGLELDSERGIVAHTILGDLLDSTPYSYQDHGAIPCSFAVRGSTYGFDCGSWDIAKPLVIDPLVYSTFLGSFRDNDELISIKADSDGYAYVTGRTASWDFPRTVGAFDTTHNGFDDAFITKFNENGSALVYSTFIGGQFPDVAYSIAIDSGGNAYITGYTGSTDFPTTPGAYDRVLNEGVPPGYADAFVTKLDSTGSSLVYSTYVGGSGSDEGQALALDSSGEVFITGRAGFGFPVTPSAYDTSYNGGFYDVFVAKLNIVGSALIYGTYLGGNNSERGSSIASDSSGNAYVLGNTDSPDFPNTTNAFDTTFNGSSDAFVVKLDPSASTLVYATFIGGSSGDGGTSIAVDQYNNAYLVGGTASTDFQVTPGANDTSYNGASDAFLLKLNATGADLIFSTFLGGTATDGGSGLAIDSDGYAYISGKTESGDFPTTSNAFETVFQGFADAFVTKIDTTGSVLLYSTFIGGSADDSCRTLAIDQENATYIAGNTISGDFPTTPGAFDTTYNPSDGFVTKLTIKSASNSPPEARNLMVDAFPEATPGILHIITANPVFQWTYYDPEGTPQTDSEVRVGTSGGLDDMWAPGPAGSPLLIDMYAGLPLSAGTDYYFAVRVKDDTQWSSWNETLFHTNSIPNAPKTPIDPPDISSMPFGAQTVDWTSGGDAEYDIITFEWQVATDSGFGTIVASGSTTTNTSDAFITDPLTAYFWRVRARDDWEPMTWSPYGNSPPGYWTFNTSANGIPAATNLGIQGFTSPPGILHIIPPNIVLNWTYNDPDGDPQHSYWPKMRNASGGTDFWDMGPQLGRDSYVVHVGMGLQRGVDYIFGVAVYDGYDWSPFSEVLFRLNSIPSPPTTPATPEEATVVAANPAQKVSWTSGGDPDTGDVVTFEWRVSTDSAFTSIVANGTTISTTSSAFPTKPSTTYYWRVRAHDDWETSTWSDYGNTPPAYWTFSTLPPPNTPPDVTLTSPTGGEEWLEGSSHTITWTMHDNEDVDENLTIYINYTTGGITSQITAALKGQLSFAWAVPDVKANDVVVNITVIDTGGLRNWSQSEPFTIKALPSPPPSDILSQYWWLVVIIVAAVIVLLLLALMKRKRPEEEVPLSEPKNPPPSK